MTDLLRTFWEAVKGIASAPVYWNGLEMFVLALITVGLFLIALMITGATPHG